MLSIFNNLFIYLFIFNSKESYGPRLAPKINIDHQLVDLEEGTITEYSPYKAPGKSLPI